MGSTASKPVKSAAAAAARRQYPKQPSSAASRSPSTQAAEAATGQGKEKQQPPPDQWQQQKDAQGPTDAARGGPTYHSKEKASATRSEAIDLDARDPHFAASLRSIGPVIPNPTLSHSSTASEGAASTTSSQQQQQHPQQHQHQHPAQNISNNPALLTLSARESLTRAAEREAESIGRTSHAGREFLDAVSIKHVLAMRDRQGLTDEVIERQMRLKPGVVGKLGGKDRVVGDARGG